MGFTLTADVEALSEQLVVDFTFAPARSNEKDAETESIKT